MGMGYTLSGPLKLETARAGIERECVYACVLCVEQRLYLMWLEQATRVQGSEVMCTMNT